MDEHVVGLDVPMDDPALVRVGERTGNISKHAHGLDDAHCAAASDPRPERLAFDERHHEIWSAGHLARAQHRHDMRMLQPRYHEDLSAEALGIDVRHELGREHLHDDAPLERLVVGHEHARHPATTELALDGERRPQDFAELFGE